jgi:DNA-binding IclR family transcriptional regulator
MPERDDDSGRYVAGFESSDFLDAIQALGGQASTTEIATEVGCDRRTAYQWLSDLREQGQVSAREVGSAFLWSVDDTE